MPTSDVLLGVIPPPFNRAQALEGSQLAFGHTHPVFWDSNVRFGAMPSNIFTGVELWATECRELDDLTTGAALSMNKDNAARIISETVLRKKLYKRHGADFCQFLCHHTPGYFPEAVGDISEFEFIFSPRQRQLGVFRPLLPDIVEYVPWGLGECVAWEPSE